MKPVASAAKSFGLDIFEDTVDTATANFRFRRPDGVREAAGVVCADLLSHRNHTEFSLSYGKNAYWICWKAKYQNTGEIVFDAGFPENNHVGKKDAERGVLVWQQILESRQISCDSGKIERCQFFFPLFCRIERMIQVCFVCPPGFTSLPTVT